VNDKDALDLINSVVREALDNDTIVLSADSTAADTPGWDSIAQVNIVVSLEQKLGRAFTTQQIESFQSVGDLMHAVRAVTGS